MSGQKVTRLVRGGLSRGFIEGVQRDLGTSDGHLIGAIAPNQLLPKKIPKNHQNGPKKDQTSKGQNERPPESPKILILDYHRYTLFL